VWSTKGRVVVGGRVGTTDDGRAASPLVGWVVMTDAVAGGPLRSRTPSRCVSMRRRGLAKRMKRVRGDKSTRADSAISTRARRGVVWNARVVSFPSSRATHSNDALDASRDGLAVSWREIDDEERGTSFAYRCGATASVTARRVAQH
jgi:hypothetical protein